MEKVVIADITFSFNNSELIKCLKARGRNISLQKFDEVRAEENKIQEIIKNWKVLTKPATAFITFEEEDAFLLAIEETEKNEKLEENQKKKLLGQHLNFKRASEPTDIIWENRYFTKKDYIWRQIIAYAIIFVALLVCFELTYLIAYTSAKVAAVFPTTRYCPDIVNAYGSYLEQYAI